MEKYNFNITIQASPEKVWEALWNDANYREWTSVFMEGSYAESDWNEGSEIRFLSPGGSGMISRIEKRSAPHTMIFTHLKELVKGEERDIPWAGAQEAYFIESQGEYTLLTATLDLNAEFASYFQDIFPKALALVKAIAER